MSKLFYRFNMLLGSLVAAFVLYGCSNNPPEEQPRTPAEGHHGMVSSAHPLATEAGLKILKEGGNAFDAAIAVAAALNVIEPMMSGIGGYGTILVYSAEEDRVRFLNPSGRFPANLNSDVYRAPTPNYLQNRSGAKAVSTPGNVNAWEAMWNEYGSLQWESLFGHAIRYAEEGFSVDRRSARFIESSFDEFSEYSKSIYGKNGNPLAEGDTLVQNDLSQSLRLIADQGSEVFHGGELGEAVHQKMQETGGFLTLQDLRDNGSQRKRPLL